MTEITSLDDPRVSPYSRLTEAQLRMELEPDKGLFIAESHPCGARRRVGTHVPAL